VAANQTTPLPRAIFQIGSVERPVHDQALRTAARKLDILTTDDEGRTAILTEAVPLMRTLWHGAHVLCPRGCRSLADLKARARHLEAATTA
jgi:hypothetical protein